MSRRQGQAIAANSKTMTCQRCGEVGHYQYECPIKEQVYKKRPSATQRLKMPTVFNLDLPPGHKPSVAEGSSADAAATVIAGEYKMI